MRIKLSQLRRIIREVAAGALSETLHDGTSGAEEQRDAALAAAGIKPPPPKTPQSGVPLAPATRNYPAPRPRTDPLMNPMHGGVSGAEEERDDALRAAGLKEEDAELDEMTESILRAVISRASRRR